MSKIEWTGKVWNPIVGCTKIAEGCKNCYAINMAHRFSNRVDKFKGTTIKTANGINWTGKVNFDEAALQIPYKTKKPTVFFVNSMSDLFHESISFSTIKEILEVIMDNPQHRFQILTKRPSRMLHFFKHSNAFSKPELMLKFQNMWLGVSASTQADADKNIPLLLQLPFIKNLFVSLEPMTEAINLMPDGATNPHLRPRGIKWVIVGGESGHHARPIHPNWVRNIQQQCQIASVPFFFKQWGEWMPNDVINNWDDLIKKCDKDYHIPNGKISMMKINGEHDNKILIDGITEPLIRMIKVGKKQAGSLLDGKQYHEMPNGLKLS